MHFISRAWMGALILSICACTTLQPNFENPSLQVTSIALLPSEGVQINFDVGLKVSNPNKMALNVLGLAYDLRLDGYKVLEGVGNDIPEIPAYGSAEFHITASTNLMQSFKLFSELLNNPKSVLDYALNTKLDLGSTWLPALRLKDSGEINLTDKTNSAQ
ncbi:MAG: LEA type 2 family protein [Pseudomonadales bacterium]